LDDPNKAFAGGAAGGGTTLRADNRQTQARTANNPTAPFKLNIPRERDGDTAINSFIPDMRLFNKICKFCGDARHKDCRLVEHRTWKTCENACVRCRKKHLPGSYQGVLVPGSYQGVFCTEIITEEQETDWKVFKKYGDLTERGYELLQKCPHPSVFYDERSRRGKNRTLEAFQGFDWNNFSDGINGDGGEEKKETKKTEGGLDYNGGEEREDGDDSGKKADKSDDTAGDDNGRANKDAKSGGEGQSDEKKDTVGDGSAKRKKDPLADFSLREMLDENTKRRKKAPFVKKDKSARSKTRQIVPGGADLTCYRAWMEVGAFFPVLPNVVDEELFPHDYRWYRNQPPNRIGEFEEFKECMRKYEIEIHFVDFLDYTLDKQLHSWVKQLNLKLERWSLLPIKYTKQVCESNFIIESAAKLGSSAKAAEAHVGRGSSVRQNSFECGPIAAGVTYTGYGKWQDLGIHPKDVDFGKCILRPKDEFIDRLVDKKIYDSKAAYGNKCIRGNDLIAIQEIMGEEEEDFVRQPCMKIGQGFEILFRGLVRELKSDETGLTVCLFNNQCHHRPGSHWASLFLVKRERGRGW